MAIHSFFSVISKPLQSPRLLFSLLIYFMGVLVVGTVAQKEMGLFKATHLFFNSFFYWLGPVPIPVGASVLTLLFLNLAAHFVIKSQWHLRQLGTTMTHLSVLVLLFGGAVTLLTKKEGFIILRQNETSGTVYDYHDRRFTILKNGQPVYSGTAGGFKTGMGLHFSNLPFKIRIDAVCANCSLRGKASPGLQSMPEKTEDETNQLGLSFQVIKKNGEKSVFSVTEFAEYHPRIQSGGNVYEFILHRRNYRLPFSLLLQEFTENYYPGTDIAKSFTSSVSVMEKNQAWPVLISMNNPFRYKNYTLYQSSVLTLPDNETASVLNVVSNSGWLFPYLATFLVFAGLSLHLLVRNHGKN